MKTKPGKLVKYKLRFFILLFKNLTSEFNSLVGESPIHLLSHIVGNCFNLLAVTLFDLVFL